MSVFIYFKASVSSTIYAVPGMLKAHVPCRAIVAPLTSHLGEIDMFWAKKEADSKDVFRMIIAKNEDGPVTETFRQPFIGQHTIGNDTQKNEQFYGRVNVTSPYRDLAINDVKSEDAGQFLCHFKNTRTGESGMSTVELIVLEG